MVDRIALCQVVFSGDNNAMTKKLHGNIGDLLFVKLIRQVTN